MTARQKARKAERRAAHNAKRDRTTDALRAFDTDLVPDKGARRGPLRRKPSVAKVRRLIARASRKGNR